jgi:signal transduction histidine kinase
MHDPVPIPPDRLTGLIEAASAVVGQTDLTAVLFKTVETAMELTGAPYGALGVLGEHGVLVEFLHAGMDPETAAKIGPPPQGRGLLGATTRSREPIRVDHIAEHPESSGFPAHHPPMDSFLGVPVRIAGRTFGNLYLTDKPGGFTRDDEQVMESLAVIAGSAVATARLQRRLRRLAVVEDRERIARDLHDAIIQDLFAVGLSLQAQSQRLEAGETKATLDQTVRRLDDAIAALRRFIFDLRPPVWSTRDLQREVAELTDRLADSYPANVSLSFSGDFSTVPQAVVEDALAVLTEATSNALRHSEAGSVEVTARVDPDALTLVVSDKGRGFDPGTRGHGMGLENLRTRAARAGGEATVLSAPGEGTTVRVVLPI